MESSFLPHENLQNICWSCWTIFEKGTKGMATDTEMIHVSISKTARNRLVNFLTWQSAQGSQSKPTEKQTWNIVPICKIP